MAENKSKKTQKEAPGPLNMPGFNEAVGEKGKINFSEDRFGEAAKSLLPDWERRIQG